MKDFGRVITAMVTPMNKDFSVNYEEAARFADYLVDNGSDAIVVAGSTGEAATMSDEERLKLFSAVLEAVGKRAVVIANTGTNDTRASVEYTKKVAKLGVHGVMLVGPYYNKPPQEGFYQHFKTIAENIDLPVLIYNVPGRTASNILPATLARLAKDVKNIIAVKESSGNLEQIAEVRRVTPPDFIVYSGDDALTLPVLSVGGTGIISVASNVIGNEIKAMIDAFVAGNTQKAASINAKILPFFKAIFMTTNPIPIKEAVNLIGKNAGPVRLPLVPMTDKEREELIRVMKELGIL
ncbi:MAG: 4-hydroxy-tetrahydrodipicolinate synthase [Sporomusaceae bacterium]|jgi:4-hydroxy-tetrahydrodipicolinate synthase|nr:4-hydroxy-tetrahydrodipicolinate synthase [Sporomusaceae bacterium]